MEQPNEATAQCQQQIQQLYEGAARGMNVSGQLNLANSLRPITLQQHLASKVEHAERQLAALKRVLDALNADGELRNVAVEDIRNAVAY